MRIEYAYPVLCFPFHCCDEIFLNGKSNIDRVGDVLEEMRVDDDGDSNVVGDGDSDGISDEDS